MVLDTGGEDEVLTVTDFELTGTQATVLHSAAPLTTNPLTSSVAGAYCRSMGDATNTVRKLYFTTSSYDGAFYNVPDTEVISGRVCMRCNNSSAGGFITIKDSLSFTGSESADAKGYKFGLYFNAIRLTGDNNVDLITNSSAYLDNTWFSFRMDVFPLGVLADRIICYMEVASSGSSTSSPGSGIWNSTIGGTLFDITVAVADARYAPWGNNGRNGVSQTSDAGSTYYFDNINFTTYDAP